MSDQSQPYAHRRPPTGIPDSFSRLINSFDRRLHVLEQRRPKSSSTGCCYALLVAAGGSEDPGDMWEQHSAASEGLAAPTLLNIDL